MPANLPAEHRGKPQLVDRSVDHEIPARVWSSWTPEFGRRGLVRALTNGERAAVLVREQTLQASLAPFSFEEKDSAIIAISDMLSGFRSLKQGEEDAVAMLDSLQRLLAEFPLWAIQEGCRAIHQGRATVDGRRLDRRYPPHDTEIYGVIEEIVKPFRETLRRATALLDAPIDTKQSALNKSA